MLSLALLRIRKCLRCGLCFLYIGDGPQGPEAARRRFMALHHHPSRLRIREKTVRLTVNKDHVDLSQGETPETTTTVGLRLLEQFKKTIDKQYVRPPFIHFCDDSIVATSFVYGHKLAVTYSPFSSLEDFLVLQNSCADSTCILFLRDH